MIAAEQLREDIVERRRNFMLARLFAEPGRFVFLDESGAKTNMTRLYGRSAVGVRCVDHTPSGHWKTMTMLSAIREEGVIEDATVVVSSAMNGALFLDYVERDLVPAFRPGEIVVMDNLASHKVKGVREAIEDAGCDLWYLPAYSPDLNPIEKLWSKVKSWLRRVSAATVEVFYEAIADALRAVGPEECANYFKACGYGDS